MKSTASGSSRHWGGISLVTACIICTSMISIALGNAEVIKAGQAAPSPESVDLFPDKARIRFARCFTIEYHGTYKRLEVFSPWSNAKETFVYILVARGHTPPRDVPRDAVTIRIPVERIAVYSTTWSAFFPMLHVETALVGLAGCDWASTPEIVSLIRQGRITEIGDGRRGMNRQINMERLTLLRPDCIMVYATGIPEYDHGPKLLEAGFKPLINASHMETTPLGRTEWIKFIAAFFNKEAEAEKVFDDIVNRYEAMAEKTRTVSRRPTVLSGVAWRGTWYVPGGASYHARFLADAGADYLWRDDTSAGSRPVAIETVFDRAREAEFWVDTKMCASLTELLAVDERYGLFASFRTGKVFNNDARVTPEGGNDYWETGVARPDLELADLISIFHPKLIPDHERIWYRQLPSRTEGR